MRHPSMARLLSLGCRPKWSLLSTVSLSDPGEHVTRRLREAVAFLAGASADTHDTVSVPGWYEQLSAAGCTALTKRHTASSATRVTTPQHSHPLALDAAIAQAEGSLPERSAAAAVIALAHPGNSLAFSAAASDPARKNF